MNWSYAWTISKPKTTRIIKWNPTRSWQTLNKFIINYFICKFRSTIDTIQITSYKYANIINCQLQYDGYWITKQDQTFFCTTKNILNLNEIPTLVNKWLWLMCTNKAIKVWIDAITICSFFIFFIHNVVSRKGI